MNERKSIKDWSFDDRPREKLMTKGVEALSNSELIAIILRSGNTKKSAVELAQEILASCKNNLNELSKKNFHDLMKFSGIGEAKAISVVATLELGRRRQQQNVLEVKKISSSIDVFNFFQPIMGDLPYEEFRILFLNRANHIIDSMKISQGGTIGTIIDIKIILKNAITRFAQGIIVAHNHPSGNITPSESDIDITQKIKKSATILDISLLDHIIIANYDYFSFADNGLI
jgi:DNA repair protein RadC